MRAGGNKEAGARRDTRRRALIYCKDLRLYYYSY